MNTNLTMQKAIALLAYIAVLALLFPTPLAVFASTIAVEEPGNTVIEDGVSDFQLRNCDPSSPDRHCSLPPDALLTSPPFTDIIKAHITYAGGGLVELSMTFDKPIPDGPDNFKFLSWFWQFENGCIGGQPGPTDKDAVHIGWNGSNFRAEWVVIKNCAPREMEIGPAIPFRFSNERRTVSVQVDLCDLAARAGDPLLWWAGTRRLPFAHPTFTHTVPVDMAPDILAFNPSPPPPIILPEEPARWGGGCLGIDIKPGSFPNSINPHSRGNIPVAILSASGFDVPARVDASTLTFGRTGDERSLDFCNAEDVNGDGLADLVCHFDTQTAGFGAGDEQGILKGLTVGSNPLLLVGRDSVRIVGPGK